MALKFVCPGCGETTVLNDRMAGRPFPCPECGRRNTVPTRSKRKAVEDDDVADTEPGRGRLVPLLLVVGFFGLTVLCIGAVIAWQAYLGKSPPPEIPQAQAPEPPPVRKNPNEDWLKRAIDALARNDYDLAVSCASEALKENPKSIEAYRARAEGYRGRKQYESALTDYTDIIKLNPKDGNAYLGRAYIYAMTADVPRAVDNCKTAEQLGIPRAQASEKVAGVLRQSGDTLVQNCRKIVKDFGGLSTTDEILSVLSTAAGDSAKKGSELFDGASQLSPKDPTIYESWALLHLTFSAWDEAIRVSSLGLKMTGKRPLLFFYRGAAWSQKGDRAKADLDYRVAVNLDGRVAGERGGFYK